MLPGHQPRPTIRPHTGFEYLDDDWAALCRTHRDCSEPLDGWMAAEPALAGLRCLADVVPPPGHDRYERFAALARITATGDRLAARSLLQLLVPGLARMAGDLERGSLDTGVGGDVVAAAWGYIERLRIGELRWWAPTYVLRSVRRDLLGERARERSLVGETGGQVAVLEADARRFGVPSAESMAFDGTDARALLDEAADSGTISPLVADLVWLCIARDLPVASAAAALGIPLSSAYRMRNRAVTSLRAALVPAHLPADAA